MLRAFALLSAPFIAVPHAIGLYQLTEAGNVGGFLFCVAMGGLIHAQTHRDLDRYRRQGYT